MENISGGERNRVQLAKVLRSGANVLLLDEPTNDLDVDTIRSLEEALLQVQHHMPPPFGPSHIYCNRCAIGC